MKQSKEPFVAMEHVPELAQHIFDWAIQGVPQVASASKLATSYLQRYQDKDVAVDALIRWQSSWNFSTGVLTSLGGTIALPITVPAALTASWFIQMRMAAAIAIIYGKALDDAHVQELIMMMAMGEVTRKPLKEACVRLGTGTARVAVNRVSGQTIKYINGKMGFRVVTRAGSQGVINLVRYVPAVGYVIGGLIDAGMCAIVGMLAKQQFKQPMETLRTTVEI